MAFDDIDKQIDDLLYKQTEFRYADRQLRVSANIAATTAGGSASDKPATFELELARRHGRLLATLSGAHHHATSRVRMHRAQLGNGCCGVHLSYSPFPADAAPLLGCLRCVVRANYGMDGGGVGTAAAVPAMGPGRGAGPRAVAPSASSDSLASAGVVGAAGALLAGGTPLSGPPAPALADNEATLGFVFEDGSPPHEAGVAFSLEGDAVAARLRATALLRARGVMGSGGTTSLGVEMVSSDARPLYAEVRNVALRYTGSAFTEEGRGPGYWLGLNTGADAGGAGSAGGAVPAASPALASVASTSPPPPPPLPPLLPRPRPAALAATTNAPLPAAKADGGAVAAGVDAAAARGDFSAVLRTDCCEEFHGWRASCLQRCGWFGGCSFGLDVRRRTRSVLPEDEAGAAAVPVAGAVAAQGGGGGGGGLGGGGGRGASDSAFLLTAGARIGSDVDGGRGLSLRVDSMGVVALAYSLRLAGVLDGTATLAAQLRPAAVFDPSADAAKLGFFFTSDGFPLKRKT
eukprot:g1963.t1